MKTGYDASDDILVPHFTDKPVKPPSNRCAGRWDWFLVPVNRQFAAQQLNAECRVVGTVGWRQPKGHTY